MVMNRLEAARNLTGNQNPVKQFAIDQARRILQAAGVEDPGMPVVTSVSEKQTAAPIEAKPILQEYRPFTNEEERTLIEDGAYFIDLDGETIEGQQTAKRLFRYVTDGGDRLLKLPSIKARVAIYTDPKRFFIPNSSNKDLQTQEKLAKKDGQELRKRLGLEEDGLDVIIPDQASTLTELIFKYLDETTKQGRGVWLFGPEYAAAQGASFVYGRTKNPVNESGSHVAVVGAANPDDGVVVGGWCCRGNDDVPVVRLVVAKKK